MDAASSATDRVVAGERRGGRRRGWVLVVGCVVALALVGGVVVRYVVVPWGVRRALGAGVLSPVSFETRTVGLGRMRLTKLTAGAEAADAARAAGAGGADASGAAAAGSVGAPDTKAGSGLTAGPWLTAGEVEITYSLGGLMSGRVEGITVRDAVWTVRVREGGVDWGLVPRKATGPITLDLPLDRVEVSGAVVRVETKEKAYEVAADVTLSATAAGIRAEASVAGLGGSLDLAVRAGADAGVLSVEIDSAMPAEFTIEESDVSVTLGSISGRLRLAPDASGATVPEGSLDVRGGVVKAGDVALSDLELGVVVRQSHEVELTRLTAIVGDGGVLRVEPFVIDPAAPMIRTRISAANLSLQEWVPVVTGEHATGEGRIGGVVEIAVDLAGGTAKVTELSGGLRADANGFIQASDAEALGALLERQNPKFATDQVMRPLKEKIVAALQDFAFNELKVDLSREGEYTVAGVYISGFGRHGEDPQGLNLTLNVHAQDTIMNLASRLESLAKVKAAARGALERFFGNVPGNAPGNGAGTGAAGRRPTP